IPTNLGPIRRIRAGGVHVIAEVTDPRSLIQADSDLDGLSDYDEINIYRTDPHNSDSDGDGFNDGTEVSFGTDFRSSPSYPTRPVLAALGFQQGQSKGFALQVTPTPGHPVIVDTSNDLIHWSSWIKLQNIGQLTNLLDPSADNTGARFYRLKAE